MSDRSGVTMTSVSSAVNEYSDYNVTLSLDISISTTSSYERFISVLETTIIVVISSGIIFSNIINLIVLISASGAMPWATRLFLINLSVSDVLVGVIACAPAVLPAATNRWTYAHSHYWRQLLPDDHVTADRWTYGDVWCQVSGVAHGTSVTVSIWSISMIGIHRFGIICVTCVQYL